MRARIIAQNDRAYQSLEKAHAMKARAASLRHVVVAGDKERRRDAQRDAIRPLLSIGLSVRSPMWGLGTILRIHQKTVTLSTARGIQKEGMHWLNIEA